MKDKDLVNQIVEEAIDKIWLPFEMKFIEWEAEYMAKYIGHYVSDSKKLKPRKEIELNILV